MSDIKCGDIVKVANEPFEESKVFYLQKFVVWHNGWWFCERDDGVTDQLVGWKYCLPNDTEHEYVYEPRDLVNCHRSNYKTSKL